MTGDVARRGSDADLNDRGARNYMTAPDRDKQSGLQDEVLAGEYVLGALPPESMAELAKRVKRDRQFAAMVRRWCAG